MLILTPELLRLITFRRYNLDGEKAGKMVWKLAGETGVLDSVSCDQKVPLSICEEWWVQNCGGDRLLPDFIVSE